MTPARLLVAGVAMVAAAGCGADGASSDDGGGCDWIYAVDTDLRQLDLFAYRGGEHVQLTDDHASSYPAPSPDGETIAFVRGTGRWSECCGYDGYELWTMGSDGADAAPLVTDGDPRAPAWSPDGEELAYIDTSGGSDAGVITVLDVASGESRTVGESTLSWTFKPVWSPDGTELAWVDPSGIVRLDLADGSAETVEIRADQEIEVDGSLAWTPDGKDFLVSGLDGYSFEDGEQWLLRVDAATGEAATLAEGVQLPVALDDGRIAGLVIDREAEESELVVMDADGSGARTVATLPIWFPYNGVRVEPVDC